jgi:ABC-type transporter Mla subunit MlaD
MVANFDTDQSVVSLRQYVESLINESNRRSDAQFLAAKEAVSTALAAQEKAINAALVSADKLTSAAFVAAKEALAEAQVQLNAYKAQSNEWRGTLNDLVSKIMMRPEILAMFGATDKALADLRLYLEGKINSNEKRIAAMENLGQRAIGATEASETSSQRIKWTFEKVLSILAILVAFGTLLWKIKQ